MLQNKLQKKGVQDVANVNIMKFQSYGDLNDPVFFQFNENLIKNQDPHSEIENDETPEAEHLNDLDSEERETKKTTALSNFKSKILPDDEITDGIDSLNLK